MYYECFKPTNAHWFHSKIQRGALIFLTCPLSDQGPFSISYLESSNLASHLASPSNPSHLIYFGMHPIVFLEMRCWRRHASASTLWASCQIRKIAGAHAPGMPGTFSPSSQVSDPDMHHGTCVTHVPWCMPGSLTNGFLWNWRRGETFPAFPAHAQPAIFRIW